METIKKKNKKGGRPPQMVKKEIRASIRFTRLEYFIVKEKAAKAGVIPSVYIRQAAIHKTVKTRLTTEEGHYVRQLVGMANNINQMTKTAHQEGLLSALRYFESYRKQIDDLLKKLQHDK